MIEYLSANMWQVWAVVAVLGLILELSSGDFFIICFAIGACGAAIVSPFAGFYVQLAVFAVVTALSIFQVRPFALRYLHRGDSDRVSNADALMGRTGRVVETVKAQGYGRVAIDGDVWKAVSHETQDIPVDANVRVVGRESTIITVEPVNG
ncbi:MAG: NfeD family protein [Prevotella sp.]|nr:NfeD family protein [Prevotella sp.]